VIGAIVFALIAALGMGMVQRKTSQRSDTIIGVMWALGMAVGIILVGYHRRLQSRFNELSIWQYSHGSAQRFNDYVRHRLNYYHSGHFIFIKSLLAISFDETFATVRNVPVDAIYMVLMCAIALTVVMMMRVVGLIMVIALLTMPAAISGEFVKDMKKMMGLASILGVIFTTTGLWLSYFFNLTSGATIILVAGVVYLLTLTGKWLWKSQYRLN
jgi:zinc transport system permease protein